MSERRFHYWLWLRGGGGVITDGRVRLMLEEELRELDLLRCGTLVLILLFVMMRALRGKM